MKKYLKTLAVAALTAVIAAGAAGCVPTKENVDLDAEMQEVLSKIDFNAGQNYKGSLKVAVMRRQAEKDNIEAFVESFNARYPNINVQIEMIANYQEELVLQHAYAYGQKNYSQMPDVFWMSNEDVPSYEAKDMLMPIAYIDEADTNFSVDALVQTMVKDATYDGQLYFMPRDYNQITTFYNKEIFQKSGIPDPSTYKDENGKTREMSKAEFTKMLNDVADWMYGDQSGTTSDGKSYAEDGKVLEVQAFWNSLNYAVFKGNGASIVGDDGLMDLKSDAFLNTVYYFWDLCFNEIAAQMTDVGMSAHNLFIQGLSAICFDTRSSLSDIVKSGVCENLGVAPFPNLSDGEYYVGAGCSGYGMYRYTDDPTAAWLFLKHIVSEQGQNAFCVTGNGCPVLKSMFDKEDASWRNIKGENPGVYARLPDDFDHDAFVHKYDTAGVTIEYVDKVPVGAQEEILTKMRETVMNLVFSVRPAMLDKEHFAPYTQADILTLMRQTLDQSGAIEEMNDAIRRERAKEEQEKDKEESDGQDQTEGTQEGA